MQRHLNVLTQSSIRAYRKCQRLYKYAYVDLYRPTTVSDALNYGTLWHRIREDIWNNRPWSIADDVDHYLAARLRVMAFGYQAMWMPWLSSVEILAVESTFTLPLENPRTSRESRTFELSGQLDGIVRENGRLWNVEEKTTADDLEPDSPYWRRLRIDPQVSVYHDATARTYGEEPAGTIYIVSVKPGLQPYKATPEESRKYTLPKTKACKHCKKEPNVIHTEDGLSCDGNGTIVTDPGGKLYASMRDLDETPSEFEARLMAKVRENPEKYFRKVEVARLARDIVESKQDIWQTAVAIRESRATDTWLRNPDSCVHPYGGTCDFFDVCTGGASLDDKVMFRKATTDHEELKK